MWQAFWGAYFAAMEQVAFDAATPVYVASGLLTYMDESSALPHESPRTLPPAVGRQRLSM